MRSHLSRAMLRPFSLVLSSLLCLVSTAVLHAQPLLLGDLDEDGEATVLDLVRLQNHVNAQAGIVAPNAELLSASLFPYGDLNEDRIINQLDLDLLQIIVLGLAPLPNPFAAPVVLNPVGSTNGTNVLLIGTARPNRAIIVQGGLLPVQTMTDANGNFSVNVLLLSNRLNSLFLTASNGTFTAGIPQPLRIIQDSEPPSLFIDFPTNGAVLTTSNTVIAGRVGDMLSGFMGLAVTVTNRTLVETNSTSSLTAGAPANVNVGIGNNGTFERSLVPLVVGTNLITVAARDQHGNTVSKSISVQYSVISNQPRLLAVLGDMQITSIHRRLAQPIVIKATQADGVTPFANKLLTFQVTRSDGRLVPVNTNQLASDITSHADYSSHGTMLLQLLTDANGEASAWWAVGGDAGCGNNRVCVSSAGISNNVYFCASAQPAPAHQINIGSGNNQKAETGAFVAEPLRAWVSDGCNGVSNLPVTFTVVQGGGKLMVGTRSTASQTNQSGNGVESVPTNQIIIPTGITGHAEILLQLGPDASQNIIEANYPGNPGLPATFIAYGVGRDLAKPTTLTGLVLDNSSQPIGNALCEIFLIGESNPILLTSTDTQGRFEFTNTPTGPVHLFVYGASATTVGTNNVPFGSFPFLTYPMTLIPNAENSLPQPVLLPRLNPNNARTYYGTNDLVLTCEGIDGLKMTIKANSMRDARGLLVTPQNPTQVSLNQVHHDDVPMAIPDGASPPFAWTLQPARATFDPPIEIQYPNMSGLPAGSIAYFLSFNHDTERFEIVASGHVDGEGATIHTDSGVGLAIAGWGCNCPPYSVTGRARKCTRVAVALFGGGPKLSDPGPDPIPTGDIGDLHQAIISVDSEQVCARVFPSANSEGPQLVAAKQWIDRIKSDETECSAPKILLVGYSWGGDTVRLNGNNLNANRIDADYSITIDPIARSKSNPPFLVFYQRDCEFSGPVDLNLLASDLNPVLAAALRCSIGFPRNPFPLCLRGYIIPSAENEPDFPGTDHFSILPASTERVKSKVESLLRGAANQLSTIPLAKKFATVTDGILDSTFVLSVGNQRIQLDDDNIFIIPNVAVPDQFGPDGPGTAPDFVGDDFTRVTGVSIKNGTNQYVFSEFFQIQQGKTVVITDLTFTDVPMRKPESIKIVSDFKTLTQINQTTRVHAIANYPDATTNDVTPKTSWTSYRTSNPNVAKVNENGLVTAVTRGRVFITAVNEGATAVTQIEVSPGDLLTTVIGFVQTMNGSPAEGVRVTLAGLSQTELTGTDGRFVLTNVPTSFGLISVTATRGDDGTILIGYANRLTPLPGNITDAGIIRIASGPAAYEYKVIKSFGFPDLSGMRPVGLIKGSNGILYGITQRGGGGTNDAGTVFKVNNDGSGYIVLRSFTGKDGDGASPAAGLKQGRDGVLYGTTQYGGSFEGSDGYGTAFKLSNDGSGYAILHSFTGANGDGARPIATLTEGSNGVLYGTTPYGGSSGEGIVFKLKKDGTGYSVLHSFQDSDDDGRNPSAEVIEGTDGALYGTTTHGGDRFINGGTVFKLHNDGTGYSVLNRFGSLHQPGALIEGTDGVLYGSTAFGGRTRHGQIFKVNKNGTGFGVLHGFGDIDNDGDYPLSALMEGSDGFLYGTTYYGGSSNNGTVFKLNKDGSDFSILRSFTGSGGDAIKPNVALVEGSDGALYGTTRYGGRFDLGTMFRLNKDGTGYSVVRSFTHGGGDGLAPNAALTEGSEDFLYGTTVYGGSSGGGIVFKVNTDGSHYSILRNFGGSSGDGSNIYGALIQGSNNTLYGTTYYGGDSNRGVAFKLDQDGSDYSVLRSFTGSGADGGNSSAALTEATDGALYGTTAYGGNTNRGTVFKMNKDGSGYVVLRAFGGGADGRTPFDKVIEGRDRILYGTTSNGGLSDYGTVFKLNKDGGGYVVLHRFTEIQGDGRTPYGTLIEGSDDTLYGTTLYGGSSGSGTVFKLNKDGSSYVVIYSFTRIQGEVPVAAMIEGNDGALYGTTKWGGGSGVGTVFKLNKDGKGYTILHTFTGSGGDGSKPAAPLIRARDGILYGTTTEGGLMGLGTLFRLVPASVP